MDSGERGINPVTMTIINTQNIGGAGDRTSDPQFSSLQCYRLSCGAQQQNLHVTELKAFADNELNVPRMTISPFFDKSKKHCGKRRKCWIPAFCPFPTAFSKAFFFRVVKNRDYMVKS